jgi:hypothetical protein
LATKTGYQGAASLVKDDFLKARKGTSQSRKKAHGKERAQGRDGEFLKFER